MKWIGVVCLMVVMAACSSKNEVVKEKHGNGSPKTVFEYASDSSYTHKAFYEDGKKEMEGRALKSGKREGQWEYWFKDGKLWSTCEYKEGLKHGQSQVYYANGQLRYEGNYENDKPVGHWVFYDETGAVANEVDY